MRGSERLSAGLVSESRGCEFIFQIRSGIVIEPMPIGRDCSAKFYTPHTTAAMLATVSASMARVLLGKIAKTAKKKRANSTDYLSTAR